MIFILGYLSTTSFKASIPFGVPLFGVSKIGEYVTASA